MKIFLTGASGYIGGSLSEHLRDTGHEVLALARSEDSAARLRQRGLKVLLGDLDDAPVLARGATMTDATINAGDADHMESVQTLVATLAGTGKGLVHTSGSSIVCDDAEGRYASNDVFADDAAYTPMAHRQHRIAVDRIVRIAGVTQGIRTAVVFPTMVYGAGKGLKIESDQVPKLTTKSRERGAGVHIGPGLNMWSNVFIDDLSSLYELVVRDAPSASFYFAENGENTLKEVATAVSHSLGFEGRTEVWHLAEAEAAMGLWPRAALGSNSRVRATNARRLGWRPVGPYLPVSVGRGA